MNCRNQSICRFRRANAPRRPEFDVPVTGESKQRRAFYRAESERKQQAVQYGDRYEAFLRTCEMEATLFRPTERDHVERCLELLHRSNQLNLSTYRYSREEFGQLLEQTDVMCICTSCRDRFGEYGIVGFASLVLSKDGAVAERFCIVLSGGTEEDRERMVQLAGRGCH